MNPGEVRLGEEPVELSPGRERRTLRVTNRSRRVVRISSHYPFERANRRLEFERPAAAGFHLDIPAGESVRWAPGETQDVTLVRYRGRLADPAPDDDTTPDDATDPPR